MASPSDITEVRLNCALAADDPDFTDPVLAGFIDADGVAGASAKVWRIKAAQYVDESTQTTEAGASHRYESHKNALAQAAYWDGIAAGELVVVLPTGPVVNDIVRET